MARLECAVGDPKELLKAIGTEFHATTGEDIDAGTLERVLQPEERHVRGSLVAEPPVTERESFEGMGAWHINAETECHLVVDGIGVVQVATPRGIVTAWIGPGDVMIMRGGEHRYRPLTTQTWRARHSGPPHADLGYSATDRAAEPWPTTA